MSTGGVSLRGGLRPPRGAWLTPREPGSARETLKLAAAGVVNTPREEGSLSARGPPRTDTILPTPRTPDTTPHIQLKHRKRTGPGEVTVHWGLKDVNKPDPGQGFGVKGAKGEGVHQVFQSGLLVGVAEYKNACKEAVYQSTSREPLGKSWVRGHSMPPQTKDKDFAGFGKACPPDPLSHLAVHPKDMPPETEAAKTRYKLTHGNFDAGEQKDRNYQYPKAVTNNPGFRFGTAKEQADKYRRGMGAKMALTMEQGEEPGSVPRTTLIKQSQEAFQKVSQDYLGRSRSLMQKAQPLPPGTAYGTQSGRDVDNAGALISGFYPPDEQEPDIDLGRCNVPGRRNFVTERSTGVPSIRQDLVAPSMEKRSVASTTNYGDDLDAFGLIFPNKRGPGEDAFHARRSRAELQELVTSAGLQLEPDEFDEVFEFAVRMQEDGDQHVSLDTFKHAFGEWSIS